MTKQQKIDMLEFNAAQSQHIIKMLQAEIATLKNMLKERHTEDIIKIVNAWTSANESYSKAILALKGVL